MILVAWTLRAQKDAERTEIKEIDVATRGTTQKKDRPERLTNRSSERESASSSDNLLTA